MIKSYRNIWLLIALSLVACSSPAANPKTATVSPEAKKAKSSAIVDYLTSTIKPRIEEEPNRKLQNAERINGTDLFTPQTTITTDTIKRAKGDVSLNFVNVDLKDFLRAVLGEMLGYNYIVDPSAQGTITLEATRPIKQDAVLPIVESTLQLNGLALVKINGLYNVLPIAGAAKKANIMSNGGYKARIVPLRYISVGDMQQALEALVPAGTILSADPIHNLFVVAGNDNDIENIQNAISLFDIDSLLGLSFGLFPIKNTTAKKIGVELSSLLSGTTVANMVKLMPLDRLNAILVSSTQRQYVDEVEDWIKRLDRIGDGNQQSLYVYRVQNGRAADLVSVLNKAMTGDHSGVGTSKTTPSYAQSSSMQTGANNASSQANSSLDVQPDPLLSRETDAGEQPSSNGILRITADEVNNAILIFASPEGYRTIESALQKLDITPLQVLIEVAISEVTLNNELRYGVQYFFTKGQHNVTQIENKLGLLASSFPGFNYVWTGSQKIQATLSLLESITNVKMLASPQLLVLNNQQAHIQVGDQVPIATQSATSTLTSTAQIVNSIEYKNTGINLTVTPRVNAGGLVLLDITQEVSGVTKTTSSTLDSPTIQQRMIASSIAVNDEETIALGGLIQEHQSKTGSGIPVLQSIPYLGSLFGEDVVSGDRTELLILITPHVVKNAKDSRDITEELRSKLSTLTIGSPR